MKIRIILILLLFFPIILRGQVIQDDVNKATEPTFKTVFYNKGKVFVGTNIPPSSSNEIPAIYVQGSVKVVDGSEIDQQGITTLTGDFINSQTTASSYHQVFNNSTNTGVIRFANPNSSLTNNKPFKFPIAGTNTDIGKGTLTSYNIDLMYKQEIRFEGTSSKKDHFINFPTIELADKTYVALNSNAAATVTGITTQPGSVFSVEGRYTTASGGALNRAVEYGHIIIDGAAIRNTGTTGPYQNKYSYHMLDVQLYDYNDPATTNEYPVGGTLQYAPVNLSGITSPYEELLQDYFFFHTLFSPNKLADPSNSFEANVDPKEKMYAGEGYVVAMNLSDFDHDLINRNWDVSKNNRASGGFQLSTLFLDQKEGFVVGKREIGEKLSGVLPLDKEEGYIDHRSKESFLTKSSTVSIPVKDYNNGKFFLANPFMAPLDLGSLITNTPVNTFGLNVSDDVNTAEIRNKFWILNESALSYNPNAQLNYYKFHYFSNANAGATGYLDHPSSTQYIIAPMQVFIVQPGFGLTNTSAFTFDTSKLTHSNVVSSKNAKEISDELLIQVINEDTQAEDRHAIVLSNAAKAGVKDLSDDEKDDLDYKFKTGAEGVYITDQREGAVYTEKLLPGKSGVSLKAMRTNVIPTTTKQLPLYVSPTEVSQRMVLRPYRIESLYSVEGVWLEDKQLNTVTQLTPGIEYPFESTLRTDKNAQENRFVLHFAKVDNDDWYKETLTPISCYYNSSILYIMGLNNDDINSNVEIFDIQGRLIGKTKINIAPRMEYPIPVISGTYIVKITGKRNFTTKFLSTQN